MTTHSLRRPLLGLAVLGGAGLLLVGSGRFGSPLVSRGTPEPVVLSHAGGSGGEVEVAPPGRMAITGPVLQTVAAVSFDGDVRQLPQAPASADTFRPELEVGGNELKAPAPQFGDQAAQPPRSVLAPAGTMPAPIQNFDGIDHATGLGGWPPDTNGDVGFNEYIQTVNTAIGIYSKTGTPLAVMSFNALFTGTNTACDANNNGDPVVLYDAQYNRWLVSDFAWTNNDAGPYYECIAVSKTNNPLVGGWWFYALRADDNAHNWLNDYPKLGVWPDGIYMSANMFDCVNSCGSGTAFQAVRVWALNRDDLYRGAALRVVHFDTSSSYFSLLPGNFRGASPPAGSPNYFVSNDRSVFALDVFKFHVDWTHTANSTFTGPTQVAISAFVAAVSVPQPSGGNTLDSLGDRLMAQNQYKNVAGTESIWVTHSVGDTGTGFDGVRWYQLNVTGGTVAATPVQQRTFRPDSNHRWMPSLAVDRVGNMAIGYSVAGTTLSPTIRYAGRLAGDPLNFLPQDETTLIAGAGVQNNVCGAPCQRWGDYSAMTVDPSDDCTFWYTTEYYSVSGGNWQTRIGSFRFPGCAVVYTHHAFLPVVLRAAAAPPPPSDWITIMQEGFEGTWPGAGWQVSDFVSDTYVWGQRNCRAFSGRNSAWAIGGGSLGSGLDCGSHYIDFGNAWMVYGPFSLAGATAAEFNLQLWLQTEVGYDYTYWMASTDGDHFDGYGVSGSSGGAFMTESLDLGSLLGQPNVWVAVLFQSDGSINQAEGAYVDDLLLRKCSGGACPAQQSPALAAGLSQHAASVTLNAGTARP